MKLLAILVIIAFLFVGMPSVSMAAEPVLVPDSQVAEWTVTFLQADSASDNGWNAASWRGIQKLGELGVVTKTGDYNFDVALVDGGILHVKTVTNIYYNPVDIERTARAVVQDGADMVIGTWFDSAFAMAMLAEEFPDVKFVHISGFPVVKSNGKNFSTYFIRMEQGDYVAGVAVARAGLTKNGVGMVGTFPIPEPVRAVNWFEKGMQSEDPLATMTVIWIQSWLDQQKEILAAEGLIAEGFGLIRQLADTPYSSATACAAGVLAVGYGTDVTPTAPCAVITNEWNWGPGYLSEVKSLLDGTWKSQDRFEGFEVGAIVMKGPLVKSVQDVIDGFTNGTLHPECGMSGKALLADGTYQIITKTPCQTDMDILTMQWFVDGITSEYPVNQEPVTFGK